MPNNLKVGLILVGLLLLVVVFTILKRGRMPIKYALLWVIPGATILFLAIFPEIFIIIMDFCGFKTISNLVIGMLLLLIFFILMGLTILIAGQTTKINLLIQELSILKKKVELFENERE